MKIDTIFSSAMKRQAMAIRQKLKRALNQPKLYSRSKLHEYWQHPNDGMNKPEDYLKRTSRSKFLLKLLRPYIDPYDHILEIGCNVGRNLFFCGRQASSIWPGLK